MLDGKSILITGGTGSFGRLFAETVLARYKPARLIIFSRDEWKQDEMARRLPVERYPAIRYFIGDVRDRDRLHRALDGVDIVIHAAALKQVPACEYNPLEAIKTNVLGGANVIDAAIDRGVKRVVALSTDKAAAPVNLYGATKLCSDKLFVSANHYAGARPTRLAVVRYGNVVGSRGSVVPLFFRLRETGVLPITDPRMTRFWITLHQGVDFVLRALQWMSGGEIFVPKLPSMKIVDLARAIASDCRLETVGVRPGEKLHETMIPVDDARCALQFDDHYTIMPHPESMRFSRAPSELEATGRPCPEEFHYSSDTNTQWLTVEQLREIVRPLQAEDRQHEVPSTGS